MSLKTNEWGKNANVRPSIEPKQNVIIPNMQRSGNKNGKGYMDYKILQTKESHYQWIVVGE